MQRNGFPDGVEPFLGVGLVEDGAMTVPAHHVTAAAFCGARPAVVLAGDNIAGRRETEVVAALSRTAYGKRLRAPDGIVVVARSDQRVGNFVQQRFPQFRIGRIPGKFAGQRDGAIRVTAAARPPGSAVKGEARSARPRSLCAA